MKRVGEREMQKKPPPPTTTKKNDRKEQGEQKIQRKDES